MLTKVIIYATPGGAFKLVEVPFPWRYGEPLPADALEERFATAVEALSALAERGRAQQRVHVPQPEKKPKAAASARGVNVITPDDATVEMSGNRAAHSDEREVRARRR